MLLFEGDGGASAFFEVERLALCRHSRDREKDHVVAERYGRETTRATFHFPTYAAIDRFVQLEFSHVQIGNEWLYITEQCRSLFPAVQNGALLIG